MNSVKGEEKKKHKPKKKGETNTLGMGLSLVRNKGHTCPISIVPWDLGQNMFKNY